MCDLENLKNEETMTRIESQRHRKKKKNLYDFQHIKMAVIFIGCGCIL